MTKPPTKPLEDHAKTRCRLCGATVWLYKKPLGGYVALENAPGVWVIDGHNRAYEGFDPVGFRSHWDHCPKNPILTSVAPLISESDFLWP